MGDNAEVTWLRWSSWLQVGMWWMLVSSWGEKTCGLGDVDLTFFFFLGMYADEIWNYGNLICIYIERLIWHRSILLVIRIVKHMHLIYSCLYYRYPWYPSSWIMKLLAYDRSIKATMIVALPYTLLQQKVIKRRRNFVELLEGMRCNEYPEHLSFLSKTKSYYLLVFEKSVYFFHS